MYQIAINHLSAASVNVYQEFVQETLQDVTIMCLLCWISIFLIKSSSVSYSLGI